MEFPAKSYAAVKLLFVRVGEVVDHGNKFQRLFMHVESTCYTHLRYRDRAGHGWKHLIRLCLSTNAKVVAYLRQSSKTEPLCHRY